jgi:phosphatidylglycerophosphatase A
MTFARFVASGCGAGFAPRAPGTVGSLLALVLGALLMLLPAFVLPLAVLVAALGGLWAIRASGAAEEPNGGSGGGSDGDPGWVVIDEVAGQWIALLGLPRPSAIGLLAAFLLFRLLDIAKPGPVGWADRQGGAAGIMADDLIAGAIAAGILWAIASRFPGLLTGWPG